MSRVSKQGGMPSSNLTRNMHKKHKKLGSVVYEGKSTNDDQEKAKVINRFFASVGKHDGDTKVDVLTTSASNLCPLDSKAADVSTDLWGSIPEVSRTQLTVFQRFWDDFQVVHECSGAWADLPGGYPPTKY